MLKTPGDVVRSFVRFICQNYIFGLKEYAAILCLNYEHFVIAEWWSNQTVLFFQQITFALTQCLHLFTTWRQLLVLIPTQPLHSFPVKKKGKKQSHCNFHIHKLYIYIGA